MPLRPVPVPSTRPARRRTAVGVIAVALLAAGCSSGSSGGAVAEASSVAAPADDPASDPAYAAFYDQDVTWSDCDDGFECTTVTVPVDWDDPDGATISLAAARRPADGDDRIGSLFLNPGGPGASGVSWVRTAADYYGDDLLEHFDLVGWDPRGIGDSSPVECLSDAELDSYTAMDSTPDTAAELTALQQANADFAAGCEAATGDLLAHVDTLSGVRDLDVLRAVVGDATLSYMGASYGTFLGAWYAQTFPWRVGRLALDGAVDPSLDSQGYVEGQAMGFDRALTAYLEDCLGSDSCPFTGTVSSATDSLGDLLDSADADPLPTSSDRDLTQSLMVTGIVDGMYSQSLWGDLSDALGDALDGDGTALLSMADDYNERSDDGTYGQTIQSTNAIYCLDHPETRTAAQIEQDADAVETEYPPLGGSIAWSALGCQNWPEETVLQPTELTATGAAPILVLGSTGDPATPYEWAQALAEQLDSGRLITRDGFGHTAYLQGNGCIDSAVAAYFVDGELPDEGTVCS